ncbi:MAG: zinc-dependent alcohol dehydrogenase family protein [Phycisphaeraceae bacterium]
MKQVIVEEFGGVDQLQLVELPTPDPQPGEVRVRLTSIGMNHADLMARAGKYKIASGEPPFTPGLEGGGVIEAVGEGVDESRLGQRVSISPDAPRISSPAFVGGTYVTHYVCPADKALPAPDAVPDEQLGSLWLAYLTAWGCLVWKEGIGEGSVVALPAASSSVALAAAQIVKNLGGTTIGLTTSPQKVDALEAMDSAMYDHLVVTHEPDGEMRPWHRDMKRMTDGRGVDVFFDPVAAGPYLGKEILCLAQHGTVWVYGLLGQPGVVDVTPLIRKRAAVRGWVVGEVVGAGDEVWRRGCQEIFQGFESGAYRQHVDKTFPLDDVRAAHEEMEKGKHIGKLVLVP